MMRRFECPVCGYVYDEAEKGTKWSALPETWVCPICGAARSLFRPVGNADVASSRRSGSTFVVAHRIFGYAFLALYLFFLWQMVPRLWTYQIEFPSRTVMHFTLGMAVGPILLLKILIVRFFRRMDATLAPMLGSSLFVSAVVLIGLSTPFALQESVQAWTMPEGGFLAEENLLRIRSLLLQAGLDEVTSQRLASSESLAAGRAVLRRECIECHDLRTVLAKPRTPDNWRSTVRRMADRTTLFNPLDEAEQWQVTAYLVAISPQLQQSAQQMRAEEESRQQSQQAAQAITKEKAQLAALDPTRAKQLFERKCSECHRLEVLDTASITSQNDAQDLVARMVEEGLTATEEELGQIVQYLTTAYAKPESP